MADYKKGEKRSKEIGRNIQPNKKDKITMEIAADFLDRDVKEWCKKVKYELSYIDGILVEHKLDDAEIYDELQTIKISLNRFIRRLKREVKISNQ